MGRTYVNQPFTDMESFIATDESLFEIEEFCNIDLDNKFQTDEEDDGIDNIGSLMVKNDKAGEII